ncbi:hypothetical protein F441_04460 [Phytophthora nicotianae CJ01A1]|nr:hypothetical protein F443_04488 [Phytophthora nicotianae P1569]ETK92243.1 hypothetical protein L915_04360 [Phytophthora nicotianae]ETP22174.1 hypothetical protein F441_04460 [Phytophthora nicotianae CJ01A1]ETP50059.1 hypothetical protein F442_04522 [Phytophthora nicotianae P10297]ETL45624.1 hypothetical protein L916_04326 [Phytophthora nicotianae]
MYSSHHQLVRVDHRGRNSICFSAVVLVPRNFLERGSVLDPVAGFDTSVTAEMAVSFGEIVKGRTLNI